MALEEARIREPNNRNAPPSVSQSSEVAATPGGALRESSRASHQSTLRAVPAKLTARLPRLSRSGKRSVIVAAMCSIAALPGVAVAAPEWGITMTHANAYGLQAGECPGRKEAYFPGEPAKDCGVDPFTGSGTTFSQESGFNTYSITVKNVAPPPAGPKAGDSLTCEPGRWEAAPTFTFDWFRNGAPIMGATSSEYRLTTADEGQAIQCGVLATNGTGAALAFTSVVAVEPLEASTLPMLAQGSNATVPGEGETYPHRS